MLILGHVGCTLAATQIGEAAIRKAAGRRLDAATKPLDYRWLVVGAILPDLIDKPMSFAVQPEFLDASRHIAHTLLFPLVLLVVWWLASRRRMNFLLPLAIGSALHLLLDGMFTVPSTLLWPYLG